MKLSPLLVALIVVLPLAAQDDPARSDLRNPTEWQSDWKAAFRSAREQHRLVFVDYFATWCGPCNQMDATVFSRQDVQDRLADFVLLRLDVDRSASARGQRINVLPTFAFYDPGERERFRIVGAQQPDMFSDALDKIRSVAPRFVSASDLFDAGKEMDSQFLAGNAYNRLGMGEPARTAYQLARKAAERKGEAGNAQLAEALSAFTFAREGNPSKAIKLLQNLASKPFDRPTESLIWLSLGNAFQMASDPKAAQEAYRRTQALSTPESAAYREATAAISKLQ